MPAVWFCLRYEGTTIAASQASSLPLANWATVEELQKAVIAKFGIEGIESSVLNVNANKGAYDSQEKLNLVTQLGAGAVQDLQEAVIPKYGIEGIKSLALSLYANKAAYDSQVKMDMHANLREYGSTEDDPIVVEVPTVANYSTDNTISTASLPLPEWTTV
ncbi:unnamed protein product [Phytophthora lilii]|uniref:Unnamed protein product n=1 Tax=Phytophthora lilii TaxID=2077276 RepID=A0A9W6U8G3_9STRA|nr:unnamed protein product [Phytophthora lilii]